MQVTVELLKQFGLRDHAEGLIRSWFEENGVTEIDYAQGLEILKTKQEFIEAQILENQADETFDFYVGWYENLANNPSFVMADENYIFLNEWKYGDSVFRTKQEAIDARDAVHAKNLETLKNIINIAAITSNPNGTETYKAVNLIERIEPEEADFFEYTVQANGKRRRTQSPTLAAIGLYELKDQYDRLLNYKPPISQKVQNGTLTTWTQIV